MFKIGGCEQERSFEFSVEAINISHIWGTCIMENKASNALSWSKAFREVANHFIDKLLFILCFVVLIVSALN